MMTPLRAVGIGAGYFSRFQYEAWSRIPEVKITAVADLDPEKARVMAAQFGIPRHYADWKKMVEAERPDFVDIITPPASHEEMCRFAALRGVHIICQKPLAPTLEECRSIVKYAAAAGIRFMVHENWRWQPWYREMTKILRSSVIGDFTHIEILTRLGDGWGNDAYLDRQPFFRDYPRLLIYETGVHFIDTFRYLLGEVTEVYASIRRLNPVIQGEDAAQVFLKFENGATAIWNANRYNEVESVNPRYTFGSIRADAVRGHLTMDTEANIRVKALGEPAREVQYDRLNRNFAGDCVYSLQRHFVECMQTGKEFEANGQDYLKTLEAVYAAYDSAQRMRLCGWGPGAKVRPHAVSGRGDQAGACAFR